MLNKIEKQFPVFLVASALSTLPPFYLKAEAEIFLPQIIANSTTSAENPPETQPSAPETPVKDTNNSDNQPPVTENPPETQPSPPETPVKDTNNSDNQPPVTENPPETQPSPPETPVKDTNNIDNQPPVTENPPETQPSAPETPVKDTNNSDNQPPVTENPPETQLSPPETPLKDTNNSDNQPPVTENPPETQPSPPETPVKDTDNSHNQPPVTDNPPETQPSPPETPVKDTDNSHNQAPVTENSPETHPSPTNNTAITNRSGKKRHQFRHQHPNSSHSNSNFHIPHSTSNSHFKLRHNTIKLLIHPEFIDEGIEQPKGIAAFTPTSSYQPLQVIDGAGLYKQQLPNGNLAYLQVIDLRKMEIDQLIENTENQGKNQGKYYKGEGGYDSPFFKNMLFQEVTDEYKQLHKNQVFSIINCAFFEQFQSKTQLSFPIKLNGQVLTGGSSPYGPIQQPKKEYYANIRLKALVWNEKQAYITDYNPATGAPLNKSDVKNAIVSYEYSDHPAKVIGNNPTNKYHVVGTLNKDGIPGNELLLIMTVNNATLDEAANLLRKSGVKGDIITIDGGGSTYLFNSQKGNIILPQSGNQGNNPTYRNLPHYLGFRTKNKK